MSGMYDTQQCRFTVNQFCTAVVEACSSLLRNHRIGREIQGLAQVSVKPACRNLTEDLKHAAVTLSEELRFSKAAVVFSENERNKFTCGVEENF